jgi:hypothetical protein
MALVPRSVPFLAHATMEPLNSTADVRVDRCDVWVPTQNQTAAQGMAAKVTGLDPSAVFIHTTFLGGGFGRRFGRLRLIGGPQGTEHDRPRTRRANELQRLWGNANQSNARDRSPHDAERAGSYRRGRVCGSAGCSGAVQYNFRCDPAGASAVCRSGEPTHLWAFGHAPTDVRSRAPSTVARR